MRRVLKWLLAPGLVLAGSVAAQGPSVAAMFEHQLATAKLRAQEEGSGYAPMCAAILRGAFRSHSGLFRNALSSQRDFVYALGDENVVSDPREWLARPQSEDPASQWAFKGYLDSTPLAAVLSATQTRQLLSDVNALRTVSYVHRGGIDFSCTLYIARRHGVIWSRMYVTDIKTSNGVENPAQSLYALIDFRMLQMAKSMYHESQQRKGDGR